MAKVSSLTRTKDMVLNSITTLNLNVISGLCVGLHSMSVACPDHTHLLFGAGLVIRRYYTLFIFLSEHCIVRKSHITLIVTRHHEVCLN